MTTESEALGSQRAAALIRTDEDELCSSS